MKLKLVKDIYFTPGSSFGTVHLTAPCTLCQFYDKKKVFCMNSFCTMNLKEISKLPLDKNSVKSYCSEDGCSYFQYELSMRKRLL